MSKGTHDTNRSFSIYTLLSVIFGIALGLNSAEIAPMIFQENNSHLSKFVLLIIIGSVVASGINYVLIKKGILSSQLVEQFYKREVFFNLSAVLLSAALAGIVVSYFRGLSMNSFYLSFAFLFFSLIFIFHTSLLKKRL